MLYRYQESHHDSMQRTVDTRRLLSARSASEVVCRKSDLGAVNMTWTSCRGSLHGAWSHLRSARSASEVVCRKSDLGAANTTWTSCRGSLYGAWSQPISVYEMPQELYTAMARTSCRESANLGIYTRNVQLEHRLSGLQRTFWDNCTIDLAGS